jgi:hypothetical protein
LFPLCYAVQISAAWLLLPALWAALYMVALPYTGYYAMLYGDRLVQVGRRTRTFLHFLMHRGEQERLAAEGRAIIGEIRGLAERWEAAPAGDDGETGARGRLFAATAADIDAQLGDDTATLREVTAGLERLETDWNVARETIGARERGYFTPSEDDRVRQLLLAYRNYRLVLYELLDRWSDYEDLENPAQQAKAFTVAYAAGLTLYARSLRLILAYERDRLVRAKLNEADSKFGLPGGFFDEILRAYTSPYNYRLLAAAGRYYRRKRRAVAAAWGTRIDGRWLAKTIRRERIAGRRTFCQVARRRLRLDWRLLRQWFAAPVHTGRYSLRAFVGTTLAPLHTTPWYEPALDAAVLRRLSLELEPGDVLQVRAERKLTTAILPGFWSHAAMFVGDRRALARLGLADDPRVRKYWDQLEETELGYVIEAIAPCVIIQSLEKCLHADHVVALRPSVDEAGRKAALTEAFSHVGKPYDFEFDFNVTTRLVCTELVYRSYHGRGPIAFELIKRLGRFTLTCDDIMQALLSGWESGCNPPAFEAVALVLRAVDGIAYFVPTSEIRTTLAAIKDGMRPSTLPAPQYQGA